MFLAWLGKAVWPFLGALAPWGGAKTGFIIAGLLGAVIAIGGPTGAVWINMSAKVQSAVAQCRAECRQAVLETQAASDRALSELVQSIKDDEAREPKTSGEVRKLCAKSKLCRKGGTK